MEPMLRLCKTLLGLSWKNPFLQWDMFLTWRIDRFILGGPRNSGEENGPAQPVHCSVLCGRRPGEDGERLPPPRAPGTRVLHT